MNGRVFSKKCGNCGERAVALATVPYTVQIDHEGRKYIVKLTALSIPQCGNCGTLVVDEAADREISAAFRQQAGLLAPEQIREQRESLGLSQKQLAALLNVDEVTLSRWEEGVQIQQLSLDRFLRAFFAVPELREFLGGTESVSTAEVAHQR